MTGKESWKELILVDHTLDRLAAVRVVDDQHPVVLEFQDGRVAALLGTAVLDADRSGLC